MYSSKSNQRGAAVMATSMILLFGMTLIGLSSGKTTIMEQRINNNVYSTKQAFEAAEAGNEFAIAYYNANRAAILVDADNDGFIDPISDTNMQNVGMNNQSNYTVSYRNPVANDFSVIEVTSSASNADGTSTKQIIQKIRNNPILNTIPPAPAICKEKGYINGNSRVTNLSANYTFWCGGDVKVKGSASTHTMSNSPASDKDHMNGDVVHDSNELDSLSNDEFFAGVFGSDRQQLADNANHVYANLNNYNSVLNGKENAVIWINEDSGDAQINSNTTVGSLDSPVIIIVNGKLKMNGNATIYGVVYATEKFELSGNATIYGAAITEDELKANGSAELLFEPIVIDNIMMKIGTYAKVAGSWIDS